MVGRTAGSVRRPRLPRLAVLAGTLSLVALVSAGCTPALSATAPPGTTVIDFEDYPLFCAGSEGIMPLTDCYRSKGVSIEGGRVVDFQRDRTPPVRVGGAKAIESCRRLASPLASPIQTDPSCAGGRISITFTVPVIHVAMRVGHSTDLVVQRSGSCPNAELQYGQISLVGFAEASQLGQDSVSASARCEVLVKYLGPLKKAGLDGRVEVSSPTGSITRVEIGWSDRKLTEPIIVDDLEFQPAATELTITPEPVDLGEATVSGTSAGAETTVRNDGNVPVVINAVEISGSDPDEFSLGGDCVGRTLHPRSSCRVVVTFSARGEGSRTATLTVVTARGTSRTAALMGTGIGQSSPSLLSMPRGLALLALIALFVVPGLVLLARGRTKRQRSKGGRTQRVPVRVWIQPGSATDTIRLTGPDIAAGVLFDPTSCAVTWTARRPQ